MAAGPSSSGSGARSADSGGAAAPAAPAAAAASSPLSLPNALLAVGVGCVLGMRHFWRQKHTAGFKTCWALMWPTLGGGIMLAVQPDEQQAATWLDAKQLQERREANAAIRRQFGPSAGGGGGVGSGGGGGSGAR